MGIASLAIVGVVLAIAIVALWKRFRVGPNFTITLAQIPRVVSELGDAPATPAFAVIIFNTPDRPDDRDALNLQFSVENGNVGFDWVLLAPRNVEDEAQFLAFAHDAGFAPELMEVNDVRYHRIEHGDVVELCRRVITGMYGLLGDAQVELIVQGFGWRP